MPTSGQFNHQFTNTNDEVLIKNGLRKVKVTENKIMNADGICDLIGLELGTYQAGNMSFPTAENLENVA